MGPQTGFAMALQYLACLAVAVVVVAHAAPVDHSEVQALAAANLEAPQRLEQRDQANYKMLAAMRKQGQAIYQNMESMRGDASHAEEDMHGVVQHLRHGEGNLGETKQLLKRTEAEERSVNSHGKEAYVKANAMGEQLEKAHAVTASSLPPMPRKDARLTATEKRLDAESRVAAVVFDAAKQIAGQLKAGLAHSEEVELTQRMEAQIASDMPVTEQQIETEAKQVEAIEHGNKDALKALEKIGERAFRFEDKEARANQAVD